MLLACMLDFKGNWDDHLPIKIDYNNSYHSNNGMAQYDALYRRKCRSFDWFEGEESVLFGPDLVQQVIEKLKLITSNF